MYVISILHSDTIIQMFYCNCKFGHKKSPNTQIVLEVVLEKTTPVVDNDTIIDIDL